MKKEDLEKIRDRLIDILSQQKGYFGRVSTWGLRPTKYEYIGYELDLDIIPVIELLSDNDRKCLVKIINYFEIHANPLRQMISEYNNHFLYSVYSEWAWSHFMTVVMFGMLEVAVKNTPSCIVWRNKKGGTLKNSKA